MSDPAAIELLKKENLQPLIAQIASDASPVGMDAVYVHALILEKLVQIEQRLNALEKRLEKSLES